MISFFKSKSRNYFLPFFFSLFGFSEIDAISLYILLLFSQFEFEFLPLPVCFLRADWILRQHNLIPLHSRRWTATTTAAWYWPAPAGTRRAWPPQPAARTGQSPPPPAGSRCPWRAGRRSRRRRRWGSSQSTARSRSKGTIGPCFFWLSIENLKVVVSRNFFLLSLFLFLLRTLLIGRVDWTHIFFRFLHVFTKKN